MDVRSYDPALGRFNGIDPVTHFSQGTSVAFDNNPVFFADPSGADSQSDYDWDAHNAGKPGVYKSGSFEAAMANQGLNTDGTPCNECKTKYQAKNFNYSEDDRIADNGYYTDGGHFISYGGNKSPEVFYKAITSRSRSTVSYLFKTPGSIEIANDNMRGAVGKMNLFLSVALGAMSGGVSAELRLGTMASQVVAAGASVTAYNLGPIFPEDIYMNPNDSLDMEVIIDTFRSTSNDKGDNGLILKTKIYIVKNNVKNIFITNTREVILPRESKVLRMMEDNHGKMSKYTVENPTILPFDLMIRRDN